MIAIYARWASEPSWTDDEMAFLIVGRDPRVPDLDLDDYGQDIVPEDLRQWRRTIREAIRDGAIQLVRIDDDRRGTLQTLPPVERLACLERLGLAADFDLLFRIVLRSGRTIQPTPLHNAASAKKRRGPKPGAISRYGKADAALFPDMDRLINTGSSVHGAAKKLVEDNLVAGDNTSDDSKARRLARAFGKNRKP